MCIEGSNGISERGRGDSVSGGVDDHGASEGDDPATWETLTLLGGSETPPHRKGRPKARGTGAEVEGVQGVGGPHRSEDVGESALSGDPIEAKAARVGRNFRRET